MKTANGKITLAGKLMFPSMWLTSEDLGGREATVTIAGIEMQSLKREGGGPESKPVMSFAGKKKRLVLNKTNARAIAAIHGSNADKWRGQQITIYPSTCEAFGETVTCIRIRPKANGNGHAAADWDDHVDPQDMEPDPEAPPDPPQPPETTQDEAPPGDPMAVQTKNLKLIPIIERQANADQSTLAEAEEKLNRFCQKKFKKPLSEMTSRTDLDQLAFQVDNLKVGQ